MDLAPFKKSHPDAHVYRVGEDSVAVDGDGFSSIHYGTKDHAAVRRHLSDHLPAHLRALKVEAPKRSIFRVVSDTWGRF